MEVVTRDSAIERGLKTYFTGKPCKSGHLSERRTASRHCIECANAAVKKWADDHKEYKAKYDKERKESYRERKSELDAKRNELKRLDPQTKINRAVKYRANVDYHSKRNKEYRQASAERLREYRESQKQRISARQKEHYKNNKEMYYANNRARKARLKSVGGKHTARDIESLKRLQKFKCAYCMGSIIKKMHVDHIMPIALGGSNDISNIQILCATCNLRKGAKDPIKFRQEAGALL